MIPKGIPTQDITILRAGVVDDGHGNQTPDWTAPTETVSSGWAIEPAVSERATEHLDHRDTVGDRLRARGPDDADVTALDRVRHDGTVYEIDGKPYRWRSPTGALDHTELVMQRWEG